MQIILPAVTICLACLQSLVLSGCTSPQPVAVAADREALIDLRVLVVEGRPTLESLYAVAEGQVRILPASDMALVRASIATDNLTVLSAPHIITRAGQPASISCGSEPGIGFVLSVNPAIETNGSLNLAFDYVETGTGVAARDMRASLRTGETAVVLIPAANGSGSRTLLITAATTAVAFR